MKEVESTRLPTLELCEGNLFKGPRVKALPVFKTLSKEPLYFVPAMTLLQPVRLQKGIGP